MHFVSVVYLFGAFQGLMLVSVLTSKSSVRKFSSRSLLIAFLSLNVCFLIFQFLVFERITESYPHLIGVFLPFMFLLPPLFYLYIKFEVHHEAWGSNILYHGIPFLLVAILMLPYYGSSASLKLQLLLNHEHTSEMYPFRDLLGFGLLVSATIYGSLSLKLTQKRKSRKLKWVRAFSLGFCFLVLALIIAVVFLRFEFEHHRITIAIAVITFSLFIHFIGYSALMDSSVTTGLNQNSFTKKISSQERAELREKILSALETEDNYLQSGFSINDLSKLLGSNNNYISTFINEEFNCNFPYLINSHRVEAAKKMISASEYNHLNFLGIGSAAGFSNKNSFTRIFKKHTGFTPSQFKAEHEEKMISIS
ncbi:MAG: helix-turn-helix domain-containing protein [Cyclobacteriaceae bacterium]